MKNIKFDNNIKIAIVLEGSKLFLYKDDEFLWGGEDWVKMKELVQVESMLANKDKTRFRILFSTKHGNVVENKFKLSIHFSEGYLYGSVDIDGWYNDKKIITANTDYDTFDTILEKYFVDMMDFIGIATDKEEFKQNFATFFVKMYIKEMCGQEVEIVDNNRLRHLVFNLIQEQKDGTCRLAIANREFAHP